MTTPGDGGTYGLDENPSCRYVMTLTAHMHIEDLHGGASSNVLYVCGHFQLSA